MYSIERTEGSVTIVRPTPAAGSEVTDEIIRVLIREAVGVLKNSYAPYSRYNVAAAALMGSGRIYTGVNVESASFSGTICAERNAIFHGAAQGERSLVAVAVVGGTDCADAEDLAGHDYCVPCGICRQVMRDFAHPDEMIIICAKSESDYRVWTLGEMLPESFGAEFMETQVR